MVFLCAFAMALSAAGPASPAASPRVLVDAFEDPTTWSAHPADGVELRISSDEGVHGRALKLDYKFVRGGGYAVARKTFDVPLPADYRFHLAVRGASGPQNFEFKLIDSTGANVWWSNRRDFVFPVQWDSIATKKRKIEFAWGPIGGGTLGRIAAIEFAITAGSGGEGTVWLDDLTLEELPPAVDPPPAPVLRGGYSNVIADLGGSRDLSGVRIVWAPGRAVRDYTVALVDDDGRISGAPREVRGGNGAADLLYFPDAEAASVRVRALDGDTSLQGAVAALDVLPPAWAPGINEFFAHVAAGAPAGTYPRGIVGEQPYWTAIGADRDRAEALVDEDGRIEPWKQGPSLEPFIRVGDRLLTWRDGTHAQRLVDGDLPMPIVEWDASGLRMTTTAFVAGDSGNAHLRVRYRLENRGKARTTGTLGLALRPFQVNPPAQFLNTTGGAAQVDSLFVTPATIAIAGRPVIHLAPAAARAGASTFDQGDAVADFLAAGRVPPTAGVADPFGHASGLLTWAFDLATGEARQIEIATAMDASAAGAAAAASPGDFNKAHAASAAAWRSRRGDLRIELPPAGNEALQTFRAQLGWLRVTRDGAAVQPGARSYERSWIRDGALSSSAMLRVGEPAVAKEFARWFAQFVSADGAVPCCVDQRGPDPTPEHDSHGEFVFLVAEVLRYTGDTALAAELWPAVRRAADHIDDLRATRRTDEWRTPANAPYFGLLPPSISHEGYSAKPMHSYWDDFFALRGLTDAAWLATRLGHGEEAARFAASRAEFAADFHASIVAAQKLHAIDYVPGCADLGDFDATSTTIALDPVAAGADVVAPAALARTFERYWEFFVKRRDGVEPWDAYTPYELRTIGAMVRLGQRDRANAALDWFLRDRRPAGFRHWAEVVSSDSRKPRFLGDMPHTWCGTDYVRSFVDLFAYAEGGGGKGDADSVLVVGAGVRREWLAGAGGVHIARLPTPFGPLSYRMKQAGQSVVVEIDGGVRVPAGGIRVRPPVGSVPEQIVRTLPAKVTFAGE